MSSRLQDFDKLSPAKQKLLLARLRKREEAEARNEGIPRSPRREEGGPFPLSFAQQRLWFIDRLDPGAATYNLSDALLLEGRLDVPALERTLGEIVRRHEALRTVFDEVEGKAVQWIVPPPDGRVPLAPLPITDLSGLDGEKADTEARRLAEAEAALPFDVPHGPHLRARLVRLPSTDHERWLALLSLHHIVADGWSMGVLVRELGTLYASFATGAPATLPDLPIQYPDFADWQRRTLQGETLEEHLRWWRERLAGAPPTLDLPADRPRPPVARHQGANFQAPLPADLSAALADLARQRGATPFMVLLAAFALLLARHSGQDDVVVGSPVANRNRLETEGLIGFFVNTLVLRVDAAERPGRTFLDLLDEVRATTLGAYAHQDLPFDRIVEELRPERDLSRPPLFQVSLIWQNAPSGALHLPGLTLDGLHLPARTSLVDLSVEAAERADGIAADWRFDTDLFDEPTVRRFAERFEVLLRAVMAAPARPLLDLPTLSDAEREMLAGWGRAEARFSGEESVSTLLARQAASALEAPAIEAADGERITCEDLWNRVLRLARRLRALGAGPEVCVGICLERSIDQVVAALAVIQAGGAYVPLDPGHPRERLALLLEDTKAPVVVTLEPLLPSLPETSLRRVLCLDRDRAEIEREPAEPFESGATTESLAYVMYTSGSTGRPKGVAIPHRGIARLARWGSEIGIGPEDRVLLFAPFAFDASTLEIWGALLNGARLIVPPAGPASLEEIGGWVERHGVTVLWLTAGLFHQMADSKPGGPLDQLAGLRFLLAGGDALSVPHVRQVLERLPGTVLVNGYGPTENTTFTSCHPMQGPRTFTTSVPVGRAIVGTRIVVLDRAGRPVPAGVAGELCTGGAGLARGYFSRPDLTAGAFVPDAWSGQPGERLYRTGDLARFLADGHLEILGRIDQQVKIRGFRIEPGEIESVLASHPEVGACSVVVGRDAAGKRLIACLSPRDPSAPPAVSALREWLGERLPAPMIPSAFLILDTLPLTANGKVDRRALLRLLPEPGGAGDAGPGEAPRTEVERRLAALWADLLGGAPAGVRSDFFALGGHSLLGTQLISRVREVFGVELPLRALFEDPTLGGLAARIEEMSEQPAASDAPVLPPIPRVPRDGQPLPLSFAQERLWLLDELDPGTPTLNMPFAARLSEPLEDPVLARALSEVARRHESLRTTFDSDGGRPFQRIAPFHPVPLPVIDLRGLAPDPRRDEARRLEAEESLAPFDLARGPLLRARLIRMGEADRLLLLTFHHAISDGWSLGLLMRELTALYRAFAAGLPSPLPELPIQYADYAVWQRRWLTGEALEGQIAYWRAQLGDPAKPLPVLDLPTDRPRPAVQSWRGAALTHLLDPGLTGRLGGLAQREGATLFMVLLAGFQALLARWSGQEDLVVGTPVAGRLRAETEGVIGCFLNNLALRTDLSGSPSFRALLGRVRATALEAYAHQDVPFEKLLEELRVERDLSRTPLFQVFLNMLNFPAEEGALGGGGEEAGPPEVPSKFDLTIYATETAAGLRLDLVYNADLFDRPRMAELAAQLELLLARAADDPEVRIGEIPLLTAAARAVLPDPAQPLPRTWLGAVADRVAEHARRQPGAPAAVDRAGIWTYGQLDAQAGRLASRLRAAGIGRGEVVAVFAHRGAALAAALLGIWRSGAAFAILDPAYPPARLAAILDLARPGAFLRLEAAGAPPAEVEEWVREIPRLALPEREEGWRALGGETDPGIESVEGVETGPDDLAYVAFTSGSTGTPKGILGTHAPLSHFFDWHARTFRLAAEDRFSVLSGLAHDPLLRDLFAPLWIGAALHLPDPDEMGDPGWLAAWMARERVTVAHLTPALGQLLAQGPAAGAGGLPDLRRAFFGGDVLTPADLTRLARLAPRAEVVNFYGATETPQAMGWWDEGMREAGPVPLGRGIEGVQLLVLNPAGHLAGIGEIGEIAIRTPYLALGYLGDPAATAERFLADPFAGGGEVRVYRTGDLGRYRPDGALTFAGRADAQIKIRGFRVETGEIEAALARHPAVREAAVTLAEGPDRQLLAFVILDPAVEAPDLRSWLRGQLPSYMLPAAILLLERLPLTPNRKVDRRALARLAGELIQPAAKAGEPPRNPVEETLASLWGELLGTDPARIGIHQDFFDLGGHSLLAAQLLARLWDRFQVELPLRALFEWPTIAGMAELVARSASPASVTPPLVRRDPADEPPPLSFAQQRLWFLHQLDPASPAYNLPSALRLSGPLDADALARAFSEVTRRHEVLRTRYAALDGAPVQVIDPPRASRTTLPRVDLSGLPEQAREAEAAAWVRRESRAPFDLALDHPLRARLLRLGPADHVLALTLHHIASDGWSNGLLVRELAELYSAVAAGRPASLPDLPFQYADFAVWQRRAFDAGALDGQRVYWREHLGTPPPPLELPTDRPRPAVPAYAGSERGIELPEDLAAALANLGRSRGATLFMTLLAGWAALLSRYSGQDDLTIGTPVAGRTRVEIEPLIGFFVNTLVIRADLSGDPPFADLLDRVREASLGAFGHQDLPFEELVEELRPERDLSHPPLFQVMFVLRNAKDEALEVADLAFHPLPAESGAAIFDLTLALSGDGGRRLGGMLQFKTDLFEPATIDRLLGHFRVLLAAAVSRPEERLGDLPLLTPGERAQLLGTWTDTAFAWPDDLCLHELFERQVDRSPGATALVMAETGEEISYAELDARAGRLADWLRAHGVGPEVSVGVALERSPELVVALLAVVKAGGAWVPLDPSYPPDRLSFLIEDATVAVLLTRDDLPAGRPDAPARLVSGVTPDHLAYRIYTSGSTGRPKAVLVSHRAIVNHMRWLQKAWPFSPADVLVQTFALSFDASFTDLWAPLLAGARVVLTGAPSLRDPARLAEEIARFGVTRFSSVPSWLAEMAEQPLFTSAPALRQIMTGGQEMPGALAERLAAEGRQVVNLYGPTEAAVAATIHWFTPGSGERIVPIGRPIANVRVYILGSAAEPLPAGVPGELCIGGAGVARGYGGRPDLTADRFRPDPFSEAGARLYRTGDRARWRADGVLEFLGRVDRQVKVRGFRIEPGEIEAVLARHPLIREAAVVARRAGAGDLRLVAYAVVRQPVASEDLRAWLAARLPEPMLPAFWVFLETLPRTPNGKVDLAALPEPGRVLSVEGQDRVAPRDTLERELAAIWEELLDVRPVGVRDDFFTLGGHSLLVLRLLARIEKRLSRTLPPAIIFAAPTIEELANLLRGEEEVAPGRLVRLHPHGDKPPLVWVHATAGTVTAYAEVARRLREADPDRPVWALQIAAPLPESLEALAAGHVSALREEWPAGPYLLAGWSFGGVVAFEMARQLRDAGAEVALLALVDTRAPGVQEIPRDLPSLFATFAADQGLPPDLDLVDQEALRPLFETFREHLALLASYGPAAYTGRIVLFRAAESPVPASPDLGWEPLVTGELEIRPLPGDHAGVVRGEGAGRLVAEILARLA